MKRGACVALAVVCAVVLMGQAPKPEVSDELRTRKLLIVDEAGKERAALAALKSGPVLRLSDEAGNGRALLAALEGGPMLALYDDAGKTRASLDALDGAPSLILTDEAGKPRISLDASEDGPSLFLSDEAGKARAHLYALKNGPALSLKDVLGYESVLGVATLETAKTGTETKRSAASLVMFDKEKRVIWETPE